MNISSQIILILSALGSINGLVLALYLWRKKEPSFANRFLAGMLVMISIRTLKSVLFHFNPDIAKIILQLGLSSCLLIGPMLYFFCLSHVNKLNVQALNWKLHLAALSLLILVVGSFYPYSEYPTLWGSVFYRTINLIWLAYLILAGFVIYPVAKQCIIGKRVSHHDIWLFAVFLGNLVIWLAYFTAFYTSYIVGALSFSFILLLAVLALIFRQSEAKDAAKYGKQKIDTMEAQHSIEKLRILMVEQQLFLEPSISMPKVAKRMSMPTPKFSQLLNDNLQKPFATFINEYRIDYATQLLTNEQDKTIDDIATCCGFNSLSTFYSTFKKLTGLTPAKYKAAAQSDPTKL